MASPISCGFLEKHNIYQYLSSSIICFLPLLLSTHFGLHQAIEEDKFPEFTVEGYDQSKKTTYAAWRRLGRSMGPTMAHSGDWASVRL